MGDAAHDCGAASPHQEIRGHSATRHGARRQGHVWGALRLCKPSFMGRTCMPYRTHFQMDSLLRAAPLRAAPQTQAGDLAGAQMRLRRTPRLDAVA